MGQWKGEFQQTFKTIHDVSSFESKTNKGANTDLSATTSTTSQPNINIVQALKARLIMQNLSEEKVEQIRKTMIRHEQLFKEQVQTLHKLYHIQRSVMREIGRASCTPPKLSEFHTATIQLQDDISKGSACRGTFFNPGWGATSYYHAENQTISLTTHKSISHSDLTAEDLPNNDGQMPLWEGDKKVIDSGVIKATVRRIIDLERPPEEYMDEPAEFLKNQEAETNEAGRPYRGPQKSTEISDTVRTHLGSNEQSCSRAEVEEKTTNVRQREGSGAVVGPPSEQNKCGNHMLVKRLRHPEDEGDILTGMRSAMVVQTGQQTFAPTRVQSNCGRTCSSSGQEGKMDDKSSNSENAHIDQDRERKKEKWCVDTQLENKPSHANVKPPLWLLQASATGIKSPEFDSSQKPSWTSAPSIWPERWDFVGSSMHSSGIGKEISSSTKGVMLSGTMQDVERKTLNQEAQGCGEPAQIQDTLIRQAKGMSPTVVASHTYGGANQLNPVVFTQEYPVATAIPALGLKWSLEGQPAFTAQGFVFPTVNKGTDAVPVPHPVSAAWYPQGTYFQLYQYQQQAMQDHRFSAACQGPGQTSIQSTHDENHRQKDTHGKPTSQADHFKSFQAQTRQSYEKSSSVNWTAGSPGLQVSSFSPSKQPSNKPPKHVANDGRTLEHSLDSNENRGGYHSESKSPTIRKDQLEDPFKLFVNEEKRQTDKVPRCSDHSLETWQIEGQQEDIIIRDYNHELQSNPAGETLWKNFSLNERNKGDAPNFKPSPPCKVNCSLITKRELQTTNDSSDTECSAGQRVSQSSKELELFTDKLVLSKANRLEKHASDEDIPNVLQTQGKQSQPSESSNIVNTLARETSYKMPQYSLGKDEMGIKAITTENCSSKNLTSKESYKNEDLDSSGHGSNNMLFHEGKLCKGENSHHLEHHKETCTDRTLESKPTKELLEEEQTITNPTQSRSEPVPMKEASCALVDEKCLSDGLYVQTSTSSVLPSDEDFDGQYNCHGNMGEAIASDRHIRNHGSSLVLKIEVDELDPVKQVESGSGETTMKNIQTAKLRNSDQNGSFTDLETTTQQRNHAESTCIKTDSHNQHSELQDHQTKIEEVSSKGKFSEATEYHQESSTSSEGMEEASEEEPISGETCENLAARILLSLAPSGSQIKGSAPSPTKSSLQQQGQFGYESIQSLSNKEMGSSSSHSSRDSTCHSHGRTRSPRGKRRTAQTNMHGPVSWTKSIRGRRRRTQRPRTQFTSLGKYR